VDDPAADRDCNCFCAIVHTKLRQYVLHVPLSRFLADAQLGPYLLVPHAARSV